MDQDTSNTIAKVSAVLEALARSGSPASLTDLAAVLPFPKPTLRRLLLQLMDTGMVEQDTSSRRYRLGRRLIALAAAVLDQMEIRKAATPLLYELMKATGESVYLTVLDDMNIVYVDVVEGERSIRIVTKVGMRRPAYSTATGKAMIAYLPEQVRQHLLASILQPITPFTTTSPTLLLQQLKEIQETGVAVSVDEAEVDVTGIAAPIFDVGKTCIAAVGVAVPSFRINSYTKEKIIMETKDVAKKLTALIAANKTNLLEPVPGSDI